MYMLRLREKWESEYQKKICPTQISELRKKTEEEKYFSDLVYQVFLEGTYFFLLHIMVGNTLLNMWKLLQDKICHQGTFDKKQRYIFSNLGKI